MSIQPLRDMSDWLVDTTRLEFDPSSAGGGGSVNTVTGNSPVTSTGGANPQIGLVTPLDVSFGGSGAATFAAGYLKSPGGVNPFTVQAPPIPIAEGGTGTTAFPTDKSVVFTQAGALAGNPAKLSWDGNFLGVGQIATPAIAPLDVSAAGFGASIAAIAIRPGSFIDEGAIFFFDSTGVFLRSQISSTVTQLFVAPPFGGKLSLSVPSSDTDVNGAIVMKGATSTPFQGIVLANGTNSNIVLPAGTYFYVSGPTGDYGIGGFTNPVDGRRILLFCSSSQTATILNEDGASTAGNRIRTLTGTDIVLSPGQATMIEFIYDLSIQRWIPITPTTTGGFIKQDGSVPLTAEWTAGPYKIFSANSIDVFNVVTAYGADPGGTVDCTVAVNNAITDCGAAGGGIVYFPPGTYRVVQTGATVPFIVTQGNVHIRGAGRGVTNISFEPATGGSVFQFNNSGTEINYNRISDLSFRSPDYVTQKTMVQIYDCNNFIIERVSNTPGMWWSGGGSIGVMFRGRQILRLRDCEISADFPVWIDTDPNVASISFDHSSIDSSDLLVSNYGGTGTFTATGTSVTGITPALPAANALVGWVVNIGGVTGTVASNTTTTITLNAGWGGLSGAQSFRAQPPNYCITIHDGVVFSNSSFKRLALVCGIGGITWNNTLIATASIGIDIDDVRTEQSIQPGSYAIDLRSSASQVQSLRIKNVYMDPNTHGIRLTGAKWPVLESVAYPGTGTFLNFSNTVYGPVVKSSFYQSGSSITDTSVSPTFINVVNGSNSPTTVFGSMTPSSAGLASQRAFAMRRTNNLTLVNGLNSNVVVPDTSFIPGIAGPTLAFQIGGIVSTGGDGQVLMIAYNGGQVFTINHNDGGSAAANRIFCPGGVNKTVNAANGLVTLIYNSGYPGWQVISVQ